jgi:hypothetical protein
MPGANGCAAMVANRLGDLALLRPAVEPEHLAVEADRVAPDRL